jgi:hypothetical protein
MSPAGLSRHRGIGLGHRGLADDEPDPGWRGLWWSGRTDRLTSYAAVPETRR